MMPAYLLDTNHVGMAVDRATAVGQRVYEARLAGQLSGDAVVAALILRRLVRTAGRDVVLEHWHGDPATIARLLRVVESPTRQKEGS